jgi:hypothetical protein
MTSHGLQTVSSNHFGPENDQALSLIMTQEEISGSVISGACQDLLGQIEWAHCQRAPALDVSQERKTGYVDLSMLLPALVF